MRADLIVLSLERAGEGCPDMAALVFRRLFGERPELESMFRKNPRLVQGEMFARSIECILDYVGDRDYGGNMIAAEATTHDGYEVPRETFVLFFRVIVDSLRDLLGVDWTDDINAAWRELISDLTICAAPACEETQA